MRRSTVLSLPLHLVFRGRYNRILPIYFDDNNTSFSLQLTSGLNKVEHYKAPGTVFTTLHFLRNF
jgi:hypothetical protein